MNLDEADGAVKLEPKEDDLIDLSAIDDIFGLAQGNIQSGIELAKKFLPEAEKQKVAFIENVVKEVMALGVFGQTKITDLVL